MPASAEIASALLQAEAAVPAGMTPPERFAVYRNNVVAGLIEALTSAFPATKGLVGDRFFRAAAGVHVRENPPRSPVLLHYGADFPDFLEHFPPATRLPYLADVARLECAWLEAYHAADALAVSMAALTRLPQAALDSCRLNLHPSVRLVRSRFPIASLWAANTGRGTHDAVDLKRSEAALVVRPHDQVQVHVVDPGMWMLAKAIARGQGLAAAGEAALQADPSCDTGHGLGRLFATGAIVGINSSEQWSAVP